MLILYDRILAPCLSSRTINDVRADRITATALMTRNSDRVAVRLSSGNSGTSEVVVPCGKCLCRSNVAMFACNVIGTGVDVLGMVRGRD